METPITLAPYQPTPTPMSESASNPMLPRVDSPPPATPSPKPASSMRMVWAVLIGIVVLAGGAYAWTMLNPASQVAVKSPSPTATAGAIAGWKTYTNTQYGFEMKYPTDWRLDLSVPGTFRVTDDRLTVIIAPIAHGRGLYGTPTKISNIEIDGTPGKRTDFLTQDQATFFSFIRLEYSMNGWSFDENAILLDAAAQKQLKFESGGGDSMQQTVTGEVFDFDTMNQILSTFKFTTAVDTSTWKTYTNTQYGFEVKVPNDWTIAPDSRVGFLTVVFGRPGNYVGPELGGVIGVRAQKSNETLESIKKEPNVAWESGTRYINGQPAIIGIEYGQSMGIVIYKGNIYTLQWEMITDPQILSTFKFTK